MNDNETNLLYPAAVDALKASRRASTSTLQRRLRIGYNRASDLMDMLQKHGVVGPENGASPREILIDLDTPEGFTLARNAPALAIADDRDGDAEDRLGL